MAGSIESAAGISVVPFEPGRAAEWKKFLSESDNGTLFHDLDFLNYHSPDKFNTCHLMFYREAKLLAMMPAAIETETGGRRFLKSPYGASIGGFVLPAALKTATLLQIVGELQQYAVRRGLAGVELRIGPSAYLRQPNELQPFCLIARGFALKHGWLLYLTPLAGPRETLLERLLSKSKRYDVRTNLKKGLQPREAAAGELDSFYRLLSGTYAELQASPTHTRDELADLLVRVPGRVRLFLCAYEGIEIAGVLVFMLNDAVANTFYICESEAHRKLCGPAVLVAHVAEKMAAEGLRYLDLGPSASDVHFNEGVVFFKEGFGAQGFCRTAWRWECPAA
ncbi:MAG: GNAT family N-acetyltransferase [Candidatus Binataceae bacterium]